MTASEILAVRHHRPFPLPSSRWSMRQEWHNLLFAHWAIPGDTVRALIPRELRPHLDLWDGHAYVGVVPFTIRNLRPRGVPPFPPLSNFAEINVRTYVTVDGKPGVYFFSLDAENVSAVIGARAVYGLPYFKAIFRIETEGHAVRYRSHRTMSPRPADFRAEYAPVSEDLPWRPNDESVERFLTERYCLYAVIAGHVYRTNIHHLPWPLQQAAAGIDTNSMAETVPLTLAGQPSLLHFSKFLDVLVWWPERVF